MRTISTDITDQLSGDEIKAFLLVDLDFGDVSYKYTDCDIPLYISGQVYTPASFEVQPVRYSVNNVVDMVNLDLTDIDDTMKSKFIDGTPNEANVSMSMIVMDNDWHVLGGRQGLVAGFDNTGSLAATLYDRSPYKNDITLYNNPISGEEVYEGRTIPVITFNGTNQYGSAADNNSLDSIKTFCGLFAQVSGQITSPAYRQLITKAYGGISQKYGLYLDQAELPNHFLGSFIDKGSTMSYALYDIPLSGQLYHVGARFNPYSRKTELWLNGILVHTAVSVLSGEWTNSGMLSAPLYIGGGIAGRYTNSKIAYPRAYNYAISPAQMAYLALYPWADLYDGAISFFKGQIDGWSLDESDITLTVANEMVQWNQRTLNKHSASCRWKKFSASGESSPCNYSGLETWCDRTYARCEQLLNTDNFGGFRWLPSIMGKDIWWGREKG